MTRTSRLLALLVGVGGLLSGCGTHGTLPDLLGPLGFDAGKVELRAYLTGTAIERTMVEYETGTNRTRFEVKVFAGQPGAVLDVKVNDASVASVTLNQFGIGKVQFSSQPNEVFGAQALPAAFPTLAEGDVVAVGTLSGALQLGR